MHKLKKISFVISLLFLLVIASACGSSGSHQSGSQGNSGGKKTIHVAVFSGPEADEIKKLGPMYEKEHNVSIKFSTFSYGTLFTKELQSVTSSSGTYDVVFMDDPWMPTFAGGGYLSPLSKFNYKPEGFVDGALQVDHWQPPEGYNVPVNSKTDEGYYALPVTGNVTIFTYRKDLAKKYGITPDKWTWNDVDKLAKIANEHGKIGFVMRSGSGNSAVTDLYPLVMANGGSYFNNNWLSTVDEKPFVKSVKEWVKLFKTGPDGEASFGSSDVGNYMQNGKAAAAILWPSGWANKLPDNVGIAEVPGIKQPDGSIKQVPEIGVWSAGVPENATNPKAAFKFVKWLTSEKQQKQYAQSGLDVPTRKSVILDSSLTKKYPWFKVVYQSLQDGRMRPRTTAWTKVEQIMGDLLVKAEKGKITPEQACKTAAKKINEYMKQNGLVSK